jgi:hypothetical protein
LLLNKGKRRYFNARGATPQRVAHAVIDQVADYFASRDAVIVNDERSAPLMTIAVEQIVSFERYTRLMHDLKALPQVVGATILRVDGSNVILQLAYNGSTESLLAILSQFSLLQSRSLEYRADNALAAVPVFVWREQNSHALPLE